MARPYELRRRTVLRAGAVTTGAAMLRAIPANATAAAPGPVFATDDAALGAIYADALATLAGNVRTLPYYDAPVLIEGSTYAGAWMEDAPNEALLYAPWRPDVARNTHLMYFALQSAAGQLPYSVKETTVGFGQIQMVVPIAATAWELARDTGDEELLATAYAACTRWNDWLLRYRDTRGTGLCEGFCTYDTGQDNSPRWAGIPNACPDGDAAICPDAPGLPRLCPDLSATVYGMRRALASMAEALGRGGDAAYWTEQAEFIRGRLLALLYLPDEGVFFDLDSNDRYVRVRGITIARVLGEHVVDGATADNVWTRQLGNPAAFWAPYPFPSIALDDPTFVRPIPPDSWGGASQALSAMRALRWMDHYGRSSELMTLLVRWQDAIIRQNGFLQQMDPLSGVFTEPDPGGYSPGAVVLIESVWRRSGVRPAADGLIEWNVTPPAPGVASRFDRSVGGRSASIAYAADDTATLALDGRTLFTIGGSPARLLTDARGLPVGLVGIAATAGTVLLRARNLPAIPIPLEPNEVIGLDPARWPHA